MGDGFDPGSETECAQCGEKFQACPECLEESLSCGECGAKVCFGCVLGTNGTDMTWAHVDHADQERTFNDEGEPFLCDACDSVIEESFSDDD